jgi:hypothetical protein
VSNVTQQVIVKAWNFAHVLWDDGLSYRGAFLQEWNEAGVSKLARQIAH